MDLRKLSRIEDSLRIEDNTKVQDLFLEFLNTYLQGNGIKNVTVELGKSDNPNAVLKVNDVVVGTVSLIKKDKGVKFKSRSKSTNFALNKVLVLLDNLDASILFNEDGTPSDESVNVQSEMKSKDPKSFWRAFRDRFLGIEQPSKGVVSSTVEEVGKESIESAVETATSAAGPAGDLAKNVGNLVGGVLKKVGKNIKKNETNAMSVWQSMTTKERRDLLTKNGIDQGIAGLNSKQLYKSEYWSSLRGDLIKIFKDEN